MATVSCEYPRVRVSSDNLVEYGPTLEVLVGFDPHYSPGVSHKPALPNRLIPALVDTGAMLSHVDRQLATALQLPYCGPTVISGASGPNTHPSYLAQIYIPSLDFTIYGKFASTDLLAGRQPHAAILGRKFLQVFRIVYNGQSGIVLIGKKIPVFSLQPKRKPLSP